MDNSSDTELLKQVEDPATKELMKRLLEKLDERDDRIKHLENEMTDLSKRVNQLERYSSKDCVVITNFPIQAQESLVSDVISFFAKYLRVTISPHAIKACHFLGKLMGVAKPPPVIVKFVYFHDKDAVYAARKMLKGQKNPVNGKSIFIYERLPKHDLEIKQLADSKDMIVSTHNCQVAVLTKGVDGSTRYYNVNTKAQVENAEAWAIKRTAREPPRPFFTPKQQHGTEVHKILKRLREKETDPALISEINDVIEKVSPLAKKAVLFPGDGSVEGVAEAAPP